MPRRSTSTSAFGVSKRENHDASGFYRRFTPPALSADTAIHADKSVDKLIVGDARRMDEVPDVSVALVVTSPPYFAGKEYEEALGADGGPGSYLEYLDLLRDVFAECVRKLEPGGRIAVNVANLGRRPYRSLSSDVIGILQDDLRLLLRGEIIWLKQRGSSGSCAWGSFQRPGNPVLRDLTERVVVASKGRFDRAVAAKQRAERGLPSESSMSREDFMEDTLDVWEIPAESATRVGHPAPFPLELPARLIDLYTYRGDLVLDPFVGSGTTAVAAVRGGRHYAGYDLDESYIHLAETRVAAERAQADEPGTGAGGPSGRVRLPATARLTSERDREEGKGAGELAVRDGRSARDLAQAALMAAGFTALSEGERRPGGVEVTFSATDLGGRRIWFLVAGSFTTYRSGLRRPEAIWKVLAAAAVLHDGGGNRLVVLAAGPPPVSGAGAEAVHQLTGPDRPIHAVVDLLDPAGPAYLRSLCDGAA